MAKFVYRMQNVLNIKLKLESQAKIAYGQANRKYLDEDQKLRELLIRRMQYENHLKELLDGKLDVKKVNSARADVTTMKTMVRRQMMEVHKAEIALEAAQKALNDVMKERKAQEILRDKAFEEFKKELLKQEAKEIDELVSYSYNAN